MLSNLFGAKPRSQPAARAPQSPERGTEGSITIDERTLRLESWSYTGFLALDYDGPRRAGEEVEVTCSLAYKSKPLSFCCKAKLVRVDSESRKLVGAFVDMEAAVRAKMAQVLGG